MPTIKEYPGRVSIYRPTGPSGASTIYIDIEGSTSGTPIMQLKIPAQRFAEALTGLHAVPCNFIPKHLETIGKVRERMEIQGEMPKGTYRGEDKIAERALRVLTPAGWQPPTTFRHKNYFMQGGRVWVRGWATRWVDAPESDNV